MVQYNYRKIRKPILITLVYRWRKLQKPSEKKTSTYYEIQRSELCFQCFTDVSSFILLLHCAPSLWQVLAWQLTRGNISLAPYVRNQLGPSKFLISTLGQLQNTAYSILQFGSNESNCQLISCWLWRWMFEYNCLLMSPTKHTFWIFALPLTRAVDTTEHSGLLDFAHDVARNTFAKQTIIIITVATKWLT